MTLYLVLDGKRDVQRFIANLVLFGNNSGTTNDGLCGLFTNKGYLERLHNLFNDIC